MKEKIGVLFLHSQTGFGADSAIHGHLMRELDRDRFEVHLACARSQGIEAPRALAAFRDIPGVRVRPTDFAPGFRHRTGRAILEQARTSAAFPLEFARLRDYVRRERIRIIHGTDRPRDAIYAVTLGRLTGAKSVVHVHVAWSVYYSAPARWAVRKADAVFSISRFVTGTVVATGTPRERVHTVLNGIDVARWDPATDGASLRQELGVPPAAPLLASVSRLFAQKGQRELLRAVARVRRTVPDIRLMVVGGDAIEVHGTSFTAELRALAAELGIADAVLFTGERSDIARVMAACDIFTMPSVEEPFGLVFLEAMAMQKPVVAVGDGGTPEVVDHDRSGLLATPGDIDGLAAHIATLVANPEMRRTMGAYGRSRVLAFFNAQRMARDAGAAYEAVLAR